MQKQVQHRGKTTFYRMTCSACGNRTVHAGEFGMLECLRCGHISTIGLPVLVDQKKEGTNYEDCTRKVA